MTVWRHDKDYLEAQTRGRHHSHSREEERKFKAQERKAQERKGRGHLNSQIGEFMSDFMVGVGKKTGQLLLLWLFSP